MSLQTDPVAFLAALIAIGVAVWANVISRRAAAASRASADEARRSADAAEAANLLAAEERGRALEVVDVAWRIEKAKREDTLAIRNVGTTTAYSVSALVRVGDERFDVAAGDVRGDEVFICDAAHVYEEKRRSNRAAAARMQGSGISYFPSSSMQIEARITWQSERGTPGVQIITDKK